MKELTLNELKSIEFEILQYFDSFCKENNIRYFLSHGTLLGAVRYKGFIPWDDDVDLLIPRKDYDRMISLFKDNEHYKLFAFEKNPEYRYPFAKFCDMTTQKIESITDNGVTLGVDIDLFPLDEWNDDLPKAKKEAKYLSKKMFMLSLSKLDKTGSKQIVKRILKSIVMVFCKAVGSKHYLEKISKQSISANGSNSRFVGCKVWCVYGARGIIPAEAFSDSIEIEFEGKKFPAPIGYDEYLTCLYGDYLPEPPLERQKTHHSFKAYRL